MDRNLQDNILKDLDNKIVLLTGPRQSGKTTLAKSLLDSCDYLNYDDTKDAITIKNKSWDRSKNIIILDELHKMPNWKKLVKSVFDKEGVTPKLLITGSAKMNTYRKVGDSLAGRYFQYRLFPLDICEATLYWQDEINEVFNRLMTCSGFVEPFLSGSKVYYDRWKKTHSDIILRQDLIDYQSVKDIKSIEVLIALLRDRVGSGVSFSNLANDLQKDGGTIKRWCDILEDMYIIFKVTPYHKNIARSLLKEPKYYCYDIAYLEDEAAKLENLVAISILKHLCWLEDLYGSTVSLNYCRTKEGKEIDFLVLINEIKYLIEVKTSDTSISKNFEYFKGYMPDAKCIQLVLNIDKSYTYQNIDVKPMLLWLKNIQDELKP